MVTIHFSKKQLQIVLCQSKSKIKVSAIYAVEIPDGFMINGMIQKETEFIEWLKRVVKKYNLTGKKVTITLDSTAIVYRELTTPVLSEKALNKFVYYNMSQQVSNMQENVIDYAILSKSAANELKVLTIFVPQHITDKYRHVLKAVGLKPHCFTTRVLGLIRSTQLGQKKTKSTQILAYSSSEIISAVLLSKGDFIYCNVYRYDEQVQDIESTFNERISQMMQFQKIKNPDEPVQQVMIGSLSSNSIKIAENLRSTLGINVDVLTEGKEIILPKLETAIPFDSICPAIYANASEQYRNYNLFKEIDQTKYGDDAKTKNKNSIITLLLVVNLLLVAGWGAFKFWEYSSLSKQHNQLQTIWDNPETVSKKTETDQLLTENTEMRVAITERNWVLAKVKSESRLNLAMYDQIIALKPQDVSIVAIQNKDGSKIILNSESANRTSPFTFVGLIRGTGVYEDVLYEGFDLDETTNKYKFQITLVMKAGEQE